MTAHPESEELFVLTVPGAPVPKGRPRMTRSGRAYTPAKTRNYERDISVLGKQEMRGKTPYSGPLSVSITALFAPPQSWPKWKREKVTEHGVFIKHTARPDIDNLGKVIDGLNGVVWLDDSQITDLTIHKGYSHTPGLTIVVTHRTIDVHSKTQRKP